MNEAGGLKWFVEVRAQVGGNGCEQDAGAAAAGLIDPMPESGVDGGGRGGVFDFFPDEAKAAVAFGQRLDIDETQGAAGGVLGASRGGRQGRGRR
jgi:hypothetical protein